MFLGHISLLVNLKFSIAVPPSKVEVTKVESILAGLPPSTILEVTARAISFWTYQLSQESACQALILKNAQDRQVCTEKQLNNAFEDLQSR